MVSLSEDTLVYGRETGMERKGIIMLAGTVLAAGIAIVGAFAFRYWKQGENLRFVKGMGNGINLGNTLDSTNMWDYKPDAEELEYETFWGNPKASREQFQTIYQGGFRTVRIPVTWEDHMDGEGNISETWMNRVQEVVDMALDENLYVILDTHHEEWLDLNVDKEAEITETYRYVWEQIAKRFAAYDSSLLFEGMNEPRLRESEHEWDGEDTALYAMVNRLNTAFVETVRKSGGENEGRYLLIGAYANLSTDAILEELEVPEGHIIISVHAYLPYQFCQQEDGTTRWSSENPEDVREIEDAFETMNRLFVKKNIPVILTEFGCMDKDNLKERLEWTAFYRKLAEENNIQYIWWDNGSSYGILDRKTGGWTYPQLMEALTGTNS